MDLSTKDIEDEGNLVDVVQVLKVLKAKKSFR